MLDEEQKRRERSQALYEKAKARTRTEDLMDAVWADSMALDAENRRLKAMLRDLGIEA